MPSRRTLLLWTLAAAGAAALVAFGLHSGRAASVGRVAPALPRERLAGPPVTIARLGHPAVVTFWASWCEPCTREAGALERFALSPSGQGRLIGVDWSDGLSGARAFIRRHAWSFANVRDADGRVGNDYQLTGLPTSFIIDADGRIRAVLRGPQTEHSLERALAVQ
jgi:thiol-disulfide isomerase/thioredoxin